MTFSGSTIEHESAHRVAAEILGLKVLEVETDLVPAWDGGMAGWTRIVPGDHDPLVLAVVAFAPAACTMIPWEDPSYDDDRVIVERLAPSDPLRAFFWEDTVRDRAREVVGTDEFRYRFARSMEELERSERERWIAATSFAASRWRKS